MNDLEKTFNVSVIESYGMTEAAHQMASNPLPPDSRKAGTVGKPAGPDITIIDEEGKELVQGEIGEIAIKGKNVTKGYENNEKANKESFVNGWFRTGDEGYFDTDNYLVIKDRIKEIINRGGEKISPREVDEVILNHPDVEQAVTFAVPHSILGEEIGAAVVLNKESKVTERNIQEYVSIYLSDFKIPRHIAILDDIPKGPTGKLQRIGLAERLGVTGVESSEYNVEYVLPATQTEIMLEKIWSEVLEIPNIGVDDNFFSLGGDSILAGQIIIKICDAMNLESLQLVVFLYAPTIKQMSRILKENKELPPASLVAIQSNGEKTPIYCVHACTGEILFLTPLSQKLGTDQPFYGLRARGLDGKYPSLKSVEEMANQYLREIESVQPNPPYIIGGAGVGSLIALEMARKLTSEKKPVEKLLLFDMPQSLFIQRENLVQESRVNRLFTRIRSGDIRPVIDYIFRYTQRNYRKIAQHFKPKVRIFNETWKAGDKYIWKSYTGSTILFVSKEHRNPRHTIDARIELWKNVIKGDLDIHLISGMHLDILKTPNIEILAQILIKSLQEKDPSVNE
jgi:thioesterase domain-containing protein